MIEPEFAEVSLSSEGDDAGFECELHAEEVITTLPTVHVGAVPSDDNVDEEGKDFCLPNDKVFVGTSPAKCFIGCESLVLVPCTPCCIYIPAVRGGVGCVQFSSRIFVLAPVMTLMAVLLCPFTYVSLAHDSFTSDENRCIPTNSRAEQVLLSYLLCAPYNRGVLEDDCWPTVNRDERDFFSKIVGQDIVEHFH